MQAQMKLPNDSFLHQFELELMSRYRRRLQQGTCGGSRNPRAGSRPIGVLGCGRWCVLGLQLRQSLVDLVKFVLDLGQVLGPSLVPAVEQRALPLKKFGDITHDNSEASPPEDV
jgi:hypothetical protein